jgi:hypothetical protein
MSRHYLHPVRPIDRLAEEIEAQRDPLWLRVLMWLGLSALSVCAFVGFLTVGRWLGAIVWRMP